MRDAHISSFCDHGQAELRCIYCGKARHTIHNCRIRIRWENEKRAEQKKLRDEKEAEKAEERRLVKEKRLAEEQRLASEIRVAEEQRLADEQRLVKEQHLAEDLRIAEERRLAEEHRKAEEVQRIENRRRNDVRQHSSVPGPANNSRMIEFPSTASNRLYTALEVQQLLEMSSGNQSGAARAPHMHNASNVLKRKPNNEPVSDPGQTPSKKPVFNTTRFESSSLPNRPNPTSWTTQRPTARMSTTQIPSVNSVLALTTRDSEPGVLD